MSNETIESRLREAGFADVRVEGSGASRRAEARWPGLDTTAIMPAQIASIAELPDPLTDVRHQSSWSDAPPAAPYNMIGARLVRRISTGT